MKIQKDKNSKRHSDKILTDRQTNIQDFQIIHIGMIKLKN